MNIIDLCAIKFPDDIKLGNITFRKPDNEILIAKWKVKNVPQPTEASLIAEIPQYKKDFILNNLKNECLEAIKLHFDRVAKQKQYDDAMSIVSYYESTNNKWAQESQTFIAWRDACWNVALQILNEVQTGQRAAPSVNQFLSELPIIKWG